MIFITLVLVAVTCMYLSHSIGTGKKIMTFDGTWEFIIEDNMQYARSNYNDSGRKPWTPSASPGALDDEVGDFQALYTRLDR